MNPTTHAQTYIPQYFSKLTQPKKVLIVDLILEDSLAKLSIK